jgi:hypothetical protein
MVKHERNVVYIVMGRGLTELVRSAANGRYSEEYNGWNSDGKTRKKTWADTE